MLVAHHCLSCHKRTETGPTPFEEPVSKRQLFHVQNE